jgi:hypothetical protein
MDFRQAERILALPICDSRPVAGYIAGPMEVEERNHGFPNILYNIMYNIIYISFI